MLFLKSKIMKNRKNISQYDNTTGELLDGVIVYCPSKQNPYGKGWVMNSQNALDIISEDKDLTKDALRVLYKMFAKMDFENWIYITQTEISEQLGIKKSNVSTAIKLLISKQILLKGSKVGRSFGYRLNPDYVWKGKVKNLNDYRKELEDHDKLNTKKKGLKSYKNQLNQENK